MKIKELKNIDGLLKLISKDLGLNHTYKLVCKWESYLVTLDLTLPFEWQDEFYSCEPKTIDSLQEKNERVYVILKSHYRALKDVSKFKFEQLLNHYKNQETYYLMLYLLENEHFYNIDLSYSEFAYNVESLDNNWKLPIVKLNDNLEFISLHLVERKQN